MECLFSTPEEQPLLFEWNGLERWCNSIRGGRCERLEVPENHTDVLLQFFQEPARIAMNRRLAAFRPVARRGQIPALALDGPGVRNPPVSRLRFETSRDPYGCSTMNPALRHRPAQTLSTIA